MMPVPAWEANKARRSLCSCHPTYVTCCLPPLPLASPAHSASASPWPHTARAGPTLPPSVPGCAACSAHTRIIRVQVTAARTATAKCPVRTAAAGIAPQHRAPGSHHSTATLDPTARTCTALCSVLQLSNACLASCLHAPTCCWQRCLKHLQTPCTQRWPDMSCTASSPNSSQTPAHFTGPQLGAYPPAQQIGAHHPVVGPIGGQRLLGEQPQVLQGAQGARN